MTDADKALLKEGLQLADDALTRLQEVDNSTVKHLASMLHAAIVFGEMFTATL